MFRSPVHSFVRKIISFVPRLHLGAFFHLVGSRNSPWGAPGSVFVTDGKSKYAPSRQLNLGEQINVKRFPYEVFTVNWNLKSIEHPVMAIGAVRPVAPIQLI